MKDPYAFLDREPMKSVKALAVFNPEGKYIARILAYWTAAGMVHTFAHEMGKEPQRGSAGGYGYDKYTAALSGSVIDGHKLTNHCCVSLPKPEGKEFFPRDFQPPKGFQLANWHNDKGYGDCYKLAGERYLEELGYKIITVI